MDEDLKSKLTALVRYVDWLRHEIAVMAQGRHDDQTSFQYISSQLGEIVTSTEQASNVIMEASEEILGVSSRLKGRLSESELINLREELSAKALEALEACSFQDNAGQRVTKILETLSFVEECLDSMIEVCGSDSMTKLISILPEPDKNINGVEMCGPAMPGKGISQEEIDAMFG